MNDSTELRKLSNLIDPAHGSRLALYGKLAFQNLTGVHKDAGAKLVVKTAYELGYRAITAGTCGNYGRALALYSFYAGLSCHVFVPDHYASNRLLKIKEVGGKVVRVPGTYEEAVDASQIFARNSQCYDANPVGDAGEILLGVYEQMAVEITTQLGAPPSTVWVPVGNGTTLGGIFRAFQRLGAMPALGAVGSLGNNAGTASARMGRVVQLDKNSLRESDVNEPLVNWRSLHADLVVEAVRKSRGYVYDASDDEMLLASERFAKDEAIKVAPVAAATLVAFQHYFRSETVENGTHVLLLTSASDI